MKVTKEEFVRCMEPLSIESSDELAEFYYQITVDCGWILVDRQKLEKKVQTWETMHPMEGNCPPLVAAVLKELLDG